MPFGGWSKKRKAAKRSLCNKIYVEKESDSRVNPKVITPAWIIVTRVTINLHLLLPSISKHTKNPSPRRSAHPSMRKDRLPRAWLSSRRSRIVPGQRLQGFLQSPIDSKLLVTNIPPGIYDCPTWVSWKKVGTPTQWLKWMRWKHLLPLVLKMVPRNVLSCQPKAQVKQTKKQTKSLDWLLAASDCSLGDMFAKLTIASQKK